jgi:malonyl CoA-acyl carrier protein transacylase
VKGANLAPKRKKNVKSSNRLLIAAAALALFASAGQIKAQSQTAGDGIAASPKVRQMLNERKAREAAPQQVTINQIVPQAAIAASPKVQQLRNERPAPVLQANRATATYRATGSDGITASPKVRAMLDEHRQTVEIAPLK